MDNKSIASLFKTAASLMEIHGENAFKTKGLFGASYKIENFDVPIQSLSKEALSSIDGIGKSTVEKIGEILEKGSFQQLDELILKTPKGVFDMMKLPGFGPKKVAIIWRELEIETIEALEQACIEGRIATLKGFGEKTQQALLDAITFQKANQGKLRLGDAETLAELIYQDLEQAFPDEELSFTGLIRRKMEFVDEIALLTTSRSEQTISYLTTLDYLEVNRRASGPFTVRGKFISSGCKFIVRSTNRTSFTKNLIYHTGSLQHLNAPLQNGETILKHLKTTVASSESEFYGSVGLQEIAPEMREGIQEVKLAKKNELPTLIQYEDLKGILHNHSTYSDGKNTLEEMAVYCKELGYGYLGISDHSKTAFYAGGLKEEAIIKQHEEIDRLNVKLSPFKVFKGIESDILNDGSLDYEDEILASFDFIVASIHSNYAMDIDKATTRLIKAVENPYTTILGHPTARLVLQREGYPVDHKKLIDACAANGVVIEINASPWRLDLDWRYVHYAMEKGVMLSINPDAHALEGYHDMKYGCYMGRKGGLTKAMTLNAMTKAEIEDFFFKRRSASNK